MTWNLSTNNWPFSLTQTFEWPQSTRKNKLYLVCRQLTHMDYIHLLGWGTFVPSFIWKYDEASAERTNGAKQVESLLWYDNNCLVNNSMHPDEPWMEEPSRRSISVPVRRSLRRARAILFEHDRKFLKFPTVQEFFTKKIIRDCFSAQSFIWAIPRAGVSYGLIEFYT